MNFRVFRRFFITTPILIAGLTAPGASSPDPGTWGQPGAAYASSPAPQKQKPQRRQGERYFKLTWTYHPKPEMAQNGAFRVPVPAQEEPHQSVRYEVSGARQHKKGVENGNEALLVTPNGQEPFKVTAYVTLRRYTSPAAARLRDPETEGYDGESGSSGGGGEAPAMPGPASLPPGVAAYLEPTGEIDPHSPPIEALGAALRGSTPLATTTNILRYLMRTVRYDMRRTSTVPEEVLNRKAADCGGYTALFVALCRTNGIQAREVWGLSRAYDRRTRHPRARGSAWFGDHAWADVYLPGAGWVPVEPQAGSFRPPTVVCIRMAHNEPGRGAYLKANAEAMGGHLPADEELKQPPAEPGI